MLANAARVRNGHLLVVTTLPAHRGWGGSETYWFNALLDGVAAGWEVEVVMARSQAAEARAALLTRAGVRVQWDELAAPSDLARILAAGRRRLSPNSPDAVARWWQKVFARVDPDLVWFSLPSAGMVESISRATALAARAEIPYWVVIQHAFEDGFAYDDRGADAARRILLAARRTIFIAESNRRSVERSIAMQLRNAMMSVNAISERFLASASEVRKSRPPRQTGQATLLNLARFELEAKGQHILLEVLGQERWQNRDWRLLLVGGGPMSETLGSLVRYYGFNDGRVEVLGHQEDVLPLIASADLIVMPSLSEGTPYAAVEAMAAGRPVVATPVGGFPELLCDGETGWLAEAATGRHFAAALERAWCMRSAWAEIGGAAAEHVAEHHRSGPTLEKLKALLLADAGRDQTTEATG